MSGSRFPSRWQSTEKVGHSPKKLKTGFGIPANMARPYEAPEAMPAPQPTFAREEENEVCVSKPLERSKAPRKSCFKKAAPSSVMISILGYSSCLQVDRQDFVYLVKSPLPRTTSVEDFNGLVNDILKQKLPRYSGGYQYRFSKQDMDRSCGRIAEIAVEQKVNPSDIPPGLLLPLLGRVFVVLSEPSDLPGEPRHVSPVTDGLASQLQNTMPLYAPREPCVDEESWYAGEAYEGEDECPCNLSPIWDNPLKRKRPLSPCADGYERNGGDCSCTLKVLKEIEGVIQLLTSLATEFNVPCPPPADAGGTNEPAE